MCRYIDEIKKDLDKEYDINKNSHLRKLMEIRETAYAKGMYGVALNAEVARGRVGGLYVDLSKSMVGNVDINLLPGRLTKPCVISGTTLTASETRPGFLN